MAKGPLPSPEVLRQLLRYEPETGKLFWLPRGPEWFSSCPNDPLKARVTWNGRFSGREALTANMGRGYLRGSILNHMLLAHRVAWTIYHGNWPEEQIDHINGVRSDNRIANLRAVSGIQNARNCKRQSNNTSGINGVYFCKTSQRWIASIRTNGRQRPLGRFGSLEDAAQARLAAEAALGYDPNHGRR